MMDANNPPAFPWAQQEFTLNGGSGMTLRDWFAGQALAGVIANPDASPMCIGAGFHGSKAMIAEYAYAAADAMIAARKAGQ